MDCSKFKLGQTYNKKLCIFQGCGRTSPEKHALKHFQTPRSSQHNIVINTSTWTAWCYDCDDELLPERYKKVAECMEHIKKIACVPSTDITHGKLFITILTIYLLLIDMYRYDKTWKIFWTLSQSLSLVV
jgi:hypothetical protein